MRNVFRIGLILGGVVLGLAAYRIQVDDLHSTGLRAMAQTAAGWSFLVAGVIAWMRRPSNRLGPLMIVAAFALLLRQLRYSHDALLFTTFFALGDVAYALVGQSILAYPSGRVVDRGERALVAAGYAIALVFPMAVLLFYDGSGQLLLYDPSPRESLLLVHGSADIVEVLQKTQIVLFFGVLAALFLAFIGRRLVLAGPRGRRVLAPWLMLGGFVVALRALFECVFTFFDRPLALDTVFWWQIAGVIALPLALLAGLLQARLARGRVGTLVLELEHTPPQGLQDALARALGDPTLQLVFWLPESGAFVDAAGAPVELPHEPGRAVTRLEQDDEPVVALIHDPTLLEESKLVQAAGAAARLALANARLQADLQAQLLAVRESRARIVTATDEERRRIERDLHDGAQQRLLALALALRAAERRHQDNIDPELERVLSGAVAELQGAVQDLRDLAHGFHPTLLAEQGLEAALASLSSRMPLPVAVDVSLPSRPLPQAEAAAYFVAAEALTNVAKHARAHEASVTIAAQDGHLCVVVEDDGVGGANAAGSGLRGLADRIEALAGTLTVDDAVGRGTRVSARIPNWTAS